MHDPKNMIYHYGICRKSELTPLYATDPSLFSVKMNALSDRNSAALYRINHIQNYNNLLQFSYLGLLDIKWWLFLYFQLSHRMLNA